MINVNKLMIVCEEYHTTIKVIRIVLTVIVDIPTIVGCFYRKHHQ